MKAVIALAALALLTACQERSFDERYADTAKAIREKAKGIDAEIASEAAVAEPTEAGLTSR